MRHSRSLESEPPGALYRKARITAGERESARHQTRLRVPLTRALLSAIGGLTDEGRLLVRMQRCA